MMNIDVYLRSDTGSRANNEDFAEMYSSDNKGIYILADGLGGHSGGEAASQASCRLIMSTLKKEHNFTDASLINAVEAANSRLLVEQKKNTELSDMRTTIVCAVTENNIFKYIHVGDSRLYYFKKGRLFHQSTDHSITQVSVSLGELPATQIRFSDDRNQLLKVLGNEENLRISKLEKEIIMEPGDAFLLCSDGFWEYVYELEMEIDLLKSSDAKEWYDFMTRRLLLRVTNNNDNYTAICGIIQ